MPNISLTKKFTRDSLKRANNKAGADTSQEQQQQQHDDAQMDRNKAQVIQTEMARARAKSLRTTNALHRTTHRVQQQQHQQQQAAALSPYRSFGLTPLSQHAERENPNHHHNHNNHYNAEILTSMSSLTEPTWANPSMSMDIASTLGGGGNSAHQGQGSRQQYSRMQQEMQQETVPEDDIDHDEDEDEESDDLDDAATMSTRDSKYKKMVESYSRFQRDQQQQQQQQSDAVSRNSQPVNGSETRDSPPAVDQEVAGRRTVQRSSSTRRKKTKDPSSSRSKRRSSSTSSRRSTYSVPVDPRQFETSSSKRSSHRSKSRKSGDRSSKSRSKRSSSVPPESAHSCAGDPAHDDQVAAAMAKFRMYEESQKILQQQQDEAAGVSAANTSGALVASATSIVATPTDEKSRLAIGSGSADGTEDLRDAILSTSSTVTNEHQQPQQLHQETDIPTSSKPKSATEAARMSLRPTIRRTNSNRSMASAHSESFSMASSARMTSSGNNSHLSPYHSIDQNKNGNKGGAAAAAAAGVDSSMPTSPKATTTTTTKTGLNRRSLAATTSRTQKMQQDVRARAIHKEKSKLWQSLNNKPTSKLEQDESPKISSRQGRASPQPFDERPSRTFGAAAPDSSLTILGTLLWIVKSIVWSLPKILLQFFFNRGKWEARHKSILITAATSSMGSEMARQYAMDGAKLALVAHDLHQLEELQNECRELGACKVSVYAADMTNTTSSKLTLQQATKDIGGHLDMVVVHGPTYRQGCYFEEIQDGDDISKLFKENALSGMLTLHHALPFVPKTSQSRIVVIGSSAGVLASPYQSVFAASQHALTGFCQSLRIELNQSYRAKAPKLCLVSFGDLATGKEDPLLSMGAILPPSKTYSWSGMPLQHAVHDLLDAIASGKCREFGTPTFVNRWKCLSVLAPSLVDWCIQRHVQSTHYRPSLDDTSLEGNPAALRRLGMRNQCYGSSLTNGMDIGVHSVSNKTWT